jgi:hypothetical protein
MSAHRACMARRPSNRHGVDRPDDVGSCGVKFTVPGWSPSGWDTLKEFVRGNRGEGRADTVPPVSEGGGPSCAFMIGRVPTWPLAVLGALPSTAPVTVIALTATIFHRVTRCIPERPQVVNRRATRPLASGPTLFEATGWALGTNRDFERTVTVSLPGSDLVGHEVQLSDDRPACGSAPATLR